MPRLQITLQDQFDQHHLASAFLKMIPVPCHADSVAWHVEHIVIGNELLLPSIELLFSSDVSPRIYRIVDVVDLPKE